MHRNLSNLGIAVEADGHLNRHAAISCVRNIMYVHVNSVLDYTVVSTSGTERHEYWQQEL